MAEATYEIHEDDIGTIIEVTVANSGTPENISTASTKQFKFLAPGDIQKTAEAVFATDGSDGKLRYTIEAGFLTPAGTWQLQAYLVMVGWSGHTERYIFSVYPKIF